MEPFAPPRFGKSFTSCVACEESQRLNVTVNPCNLLKSQTLQPLAFLSEDRKYRHSPERLLHRNAADLKGPRRIRLRFIPKGAALQSQTLTLACDIYNCLVPQQAHRARLRTSHCHESARIANYSLLETSHMAILHSELLRHNVIQVLKAARADL